MRFNIPNLPPLRVSVGGLQESALFAITGLNASQVYPLLGDVLLHPRDYRYPSWPGFSTHYFTASGVRAILEHFRLKGEVIDESAVPKGTRKPVAVYEELPDGALSVTVTSTDSCTYANGAMGLKLLQTMERAGHVTLQRKAVPC